MTQTQTMIVLSVLSMVSSCDSRADRDESRSAPARNQADVAPSRPLGFTIAEVCASEPALAALWSSPLADREPYLVVAIWSNGRVVWSPFTEWGGPPYLEGVLDEEDVVALLDDIEARGYFSRPPSSARLYVIDGPLLWLSVISERGEVFVRAGQMYYRDGAPESHEFLSAWQHLSDLLLGAIPPTGGIIRSYSFVSRYRATDGSWLETSQEAGCGNPESEAAFAFASRLLGPSGVHVCFDATQWPCRAHRGVVEAPAVLEQAGHPLYRFWAARRRESPTLWEVVVGEDGNLLEARTSQPLLEVR